MIGPMVGSMVVMRGIRDKRGNVQPNIDCRTSLEKRRVVHLNRLNAFHPLRCRGQGDGHGGLAVPYHIHLVPIQRLISFGSSLSSFLC